MAAIFFSRDVSWSLSFTYTATAIWTGVHFTLQGNAYEMRQIILCITTVRKSRLDRGEKSEVFFYKMGRMNPGNYACK